MNKEVNRMEYVRFEVVSIKDHPTLDEKWVQDRIGEDPKILGLGDLILKDKERMQPHAGRLDLLLQDADSVHRYEVEVQLGATDESHIIRTIEYWDLERKRYPQYDHTAVIVAEDITSRFLNIISLFNGVIPLIAIQMKALKYENKISLMCTTVIDQTKLGLVDEDEEVQEPTDRSYWENRGSKSTLAMVDELLETIKTIDPSLELKYNKFYIGLAKEGKPSNFVIFRPKKNFLRLEPRLSRSDEMQERLDKEGLDVMDYEDRWGRYRIRLSKGDIKKHAEFLTKLLAEAYGVE
jgi:predicted transport protein